MRVSFKTHILNTGHHPSHSDCAELFYKWENERHYPKKGWSFYWIPGVLRVIFLYWRLFFSLPENRCTSYWRILLLTSDISKELWVWLHPFLSVPDWGTSVWRETFCLISSLVIWEKIKHRFFQEKRTAGAQGGSTLHTQSKGRVNTPHPPGCWLIRFQVSSCCSVALHKAVESEIPAPLVETAQ